MVRPILCRALLIAAFGLTLLPVRASSAGHDSSATMAVAPPPPGYHNKKLANGMTIRVPDEKPAQPPAPSDSDEKYDPENADFSRTSSYADKAFNAGESSLSKSPQAEEAQSNRTFATSAYATRDYNQSSKTYQTVAYSNTTQSDPTFNKDYHLPAAFDSNRSFGAGKKSEFQDKQALPSKKKMDPFAAPGELTEKSFADPAMTKVKHDPYAASQGLDVSRLTDLPNRPLTIDEVRALINHDQVPDLNAKPEAPSKALNDPGWEPPEALPPAIDSRPPHPGPTSEDSAGDLPSPGMMAQPAPEPVKKD